MYNVIYDIISHTWSTSSSEQQYIYTTCCVMIVVLSAVFIDLFYRFFKSIFK